MRQFPCPRFGSSPSRLPAPRRCCPLLCPESFREMSAPIPALLPASLLKSPTRSLRLHPNGRNSSWLSPVRLIRRARQVCPIKKENERDKSCRRLPGPHESTPQNCCNSYKPRGRGSQASYVAGNEGAFAASVALRATSPRRLRLSREASVLRHRCNAVHRIQVKLHHHGVGDLVERQVMRHPKIPPVERKTSVNPVVPVVLPQ